MSNSASTSQFAIPDGYHQPLAVVNENDHTAWIVIITTLGLIYGLLFGLVRWFVRKTVCPGISTDDMLVAAATLFQLIQASVTLSACHKGLGRSPDLLTLEDITQVQRSYYASNLLFVVAIGLSKASIVFFLYRLTTNKLHRMIFAVSAGIMGLWTVGAFFAEALQCNLSHPWRIMNEDCTGSALRWKAINVFDIITEVYIVALVVFLVWPLQANLKTKCTVVSTFAARLLIVVPIAFRLATFRQLARSQGFPLAEDRFIVWGQAQMCYSIISATIPSLRPFASHMNTGFGGLGEEEREYGYNSYGKGSKNASNAGGSYIMSQLRSADREPDKDAVSKVSQRRIFSGRPGQYDVEVTGTARTSRDGRSREDKDNGAGDATSFQSQDSQQMIIRKETTYTVHHEA